MSILEEAIREHLELKRQHGADDSELKQLEDEAFGPPERPGEETASDPFAEAPTEFIAVPEGTEGAAGEGSSAIEEQPAMEHEAVVDTPQEEDAPTTEEREAIGEYPTELHDIDGAAASEAIGPSEEELPEEKGLDEEEGLDEDFFDEQRLSDELDQALEAPLEEPGGGSEVEEGNEAEDLAEHDEVGGTEERKAAVGRNQEEDVLEHTPDFLEDTPEDDQLWFEQKPPKDFNFDD